MGKISRQAYAEMYGPTTGDRVRLGDTEIIIELIQTKSHIYRLDGNSKLKINYQSENEQKRLDFLKALLEQLMGKTKA